MPRIVTGVDKGYADPVRYVLGKWQSDLNGPPPLDIGRRPNSGHEVQAVVNHSRWIAECPTDGCNGAYYFNPDDPRFWCVYCDTGWHRVVMPDDRDDIERALLERPAPQTRNWTPPETVGFLLEENREHGVGG